MIEGVPTRRKIHTAGRCFTHHKAITGRRSAGRKAAYVESQYSITEDERAAILAAQGGVCYICRRAKDTARRRLAVDHDHSCCPGKTSCGKCVRGLLCRNCNRNILGRLHDEPAALQRGIDYLTDPPAQRVLALLRGTKNV